MDFVFILYILFSIAVGIGGTMYLVQSERTLGGFLFFVGAVLIFTFYGLRWFSGDGLKVTRYESKSWPPFVNACPDFLTLTERTVGSKKEKVCVDMIGVSESAALQKLQDASDLTNNNKIFPLHLEKSGAARLRALCNECKAKGVTWEGVYDGVACTATGAVPNASGGVDTAEGENCNDQ